MSRTICEYAVTLVLLIPWLVMTRIQITLASGQQYRVVNGPHVVTWTVVTNSPAEISSLPSLGCNITCEIAHAAPALNIPSRLGRRSEDEHHRDVCLHHSRHKRALVVPGTKWCGPGNFASSRQDLGLFKDTDSCCRQHDFCPVSIDGFSTKFGLKNRSPFTLSSCQCDSQFLQCLRSVGSLESSMLGQTYFNLLSYNCFNVKVDQTTGEMKATLHNNPRF